MHHWLLMVTALAATPVCLSSQEPAQTTKAVEVITAQEITQHISVIADDSMLGRDTPSPGLEMTARYLADQFVQLGLKPGGLLPDVWLTRYPVRGVENRRLDYATSRISLFVNVNRKQKRVSISFDTAAHFTADTVVDGEFSWRVQVIVMAGPHTKASVRKENLRDAMILYVVPAGADSSIRQQVIDELSASNHVVILGNEDAAGFVQRQQAAIRQPPVVISNDMAAVIRMPRRLVLQVWPEAIKAFLADAGVDLAQVRAVSEPMVRELPQMELSLDLRKDASDTATAPNVVGALEGSDPKLKNEFIVIAAHMDHIGVASGQADSIRNGADDNASGVAGLIALAKAFTQPGARPRRSIIFLGASGSAKYFQGSNYWARAHPMSLGRQRFLAAGINLDMIGRDAGDSLRVDGLPDIQFDVPPDWIAAVHPELGLTLVDGGSITNTKSDHFVFLRERVPTLYFYNGSHEDGRADDTPATIDTEQAARILRLVFYIAHEIANNDQRPQWTSGGRQRWTEFGGR